MIKIVSTLPNSADSLHLYQDDNDVHVKEDEEEKDEDDVKEAEKDKDEDDVTEDEEDKYEDDDLELKPAKSFLSVQSEHHYSSPK